MPSLLRASVAPLQTEARRVPLALTLWDSACRGASTGPHRGPAPTLPRPGHQDGTASRMAGPAPGQLCPGLASGMDRGRCLEDGEGRVSTSVPAACRCARLGRKPFGFSRKQEAQGHTRRENPAFSRVCLVPCGHRLSCVKRGSGTPGSSAGGRVLSEGSLARVPRSPKPWPLSAGVQRGGSLPTALARSAGPRVRPQLVPGRGQPLSCCC